MSRQSRNSDKYQQLQSAIYNNIAMVCGASRCEYNDFLQHVSLRSCSTNAVLYMEKKNLSDPVGGLPMMLQRRRTRWQQQHQPPHHGDARFGRRFARLMQR